MDRSLTGCTGLQGSAWPGRARPSATAVPRSRTATTPPGQRTDPYVDGAGRCRELRADTPDDDRHQVASRGRKAAHRAFVRPALMLGTGADKRAGVSCGPD